MLENLLYETSIVTADYVMSKKNSPNRWWSFRAHLEDMLHSE